MTDAYRNTNEAVENKRQEELITKLQNKNWNVNINHRTPYKPQVEYYDEQIVIVNGVSYTRTDRTPVIIHKDENTIVVGGVKYQKIEEPKPPTLYAIIREWCDDDNGETCEEIVNKIEKEWLPDEVIEDGEDYNKGWNDCIKHLRERLK